MSEAQARQFPLSARLIAWAFVVATSVAPLALALRAYHHAEDHPPIPWGPVIVSMVLIQLLFLYLQKRCSSPGLSFWQGLYYAALYLDTGWSYFSLFVTLPALALLTAAALLLTLTAELRLRPALARVYFHRLIMFVYRNRAMQ